jgi:hypothetical protein
MRQNERIEREEFIHVYPIFNEDQIGNKQKKIALEQHFIVPWELNNDDTKIRRSII